ncbi:hypothetical protein CQW23_31420 [Capsicum baccatum]|uniref:Uncharacterized protein n=1 Tax=Capsicum baccatum TaxID=33114 RepID=A0A2G2V7P5_CAPBA|nr:hypothetical protein CQW23_31420 [Capsicum baccatum]
MGKMLMAICRTLQEENEEIGNQANEGKFAIRIITLHPNSSWLFLKSIDKPAGAGHKNGKWHVLHALCADYESNDRQRTYIMMEKMGCNKNIVAELKLPPIIIF